MAGDRPGCVFIPGGSFLMGSDDFYPEERPVRRVAVAGFRIDRGPVTNGDFARFVAATGHVTLAERAPDPADYPGADPALLVPGSLVFRPPPARCRWTIRASGGPMCRAPAGAGPRDRAAA